MDSVSRETYVMSSPTEASPNGAPQFKCGMSKSCPSEYFAFKISSGAANVVGPRMCLDDSILMSGLKNNVGKGINVAIVNGKTGNPLRMGFFDTWQGDVNLLINFLKTADNQSLVMMATFDESSSKQLITEFGSADIKTLGFRDNWVFVGRKGIKTHSPFEQRIRNSPIINKYEGWPDIAEMEGCVPKRE
ncbi:hypothetical protein JZ751_022205 [Albula glossodonta]|uniref:ILEI/PANDER domain-containing protein n=1 Tax=Albula glossodonta TaxID=121402 RepID=A0A8T2NQJ7_9TELE|nr:hypothetical protein JZ751_022205 [Albula glossodonta]